MNTPIREQRSLKNIIPYVPGKPIEEVMREYGIKDVIKLASNENPLGPSPLAIAAIEKVLSKLNLYPDGKSHHLRQALANHLGVEPEQIIVGNGTDGIIAHICLAYLDEDNEVIVSRSSFPMYDIYTHVMRARLIKTPSRDYGLDLEAMANAISEKTKLVFVCNPNNPTGTIVTKAEVETFMAKVPANVLVVFDEAYYKFVASDEYPESIEYIRQGQNNVMLLRTFSKIYGLAGIRLGYGIATPETLAPLYKIKEPFSVNLLAQAAGVAALEDEAFLQTTVEANHNGQLYLYRHFDRLGLRYVESHTNFVLVEIGPHAQAVQKALLEKGVIVRLCTGYDLPKCLRVTVGDEMQNTRFIQSLEETLQDLRSSRSGNSG